MIKVFAPGKLVIAGEWSVLESGNPAIVASVDRFLSVELIPRIDQKIILKLSDYQLEVSTEIKDHQLQFYQDLSEQSKVQLKFIKTAIEIASQYLNLNTGFELTTNSSNTNCESSARPTKIGFGSSAGITVATISALCQQFLAGTSPNFSDLVFKLSIISHFQAQNKLGSGLDIACASYGGIILYRAFDPVWLTSKIESSNLSELVECSWPNCQIEKLNIPNELIIIAGFSGYSASSTELISAMNICHNSQEIKNIYREIADNTEDLVINWKNNLLSKIIEGLSNNHLLLKRLAETSNLPLFTKELNKLIEIANDHRFTAKFSGAGGGDCGLAFGSDPKEAILIQKSWKKNGITPLSIHFGTDLKIPLTNFP